MHDHEKGKMKRVIVYGISPYASNAMMSRNPRSGIYLADTSRGLDLSGGNPACNQGGMLILQRKAMKNLYFESHPHDSRVTGPHMTASTVSAKYGTGGNNTPLIESVKGEEMESEYAVRRLMPKECARLQGFPPDYCDDVKHADSAEYKMWGNGMALPCSLYVMEGVVSELGKASK